jgi:hypothetical protein
MKKLQELTLLAVFTLIVAGTAVAGDIPIGKTPPPPDPTAVKTQNSVNTPGITQGPGLAASVTVVALNLLEDLFSVF